jgi:hypothetical protein
MAWPWRGHGTRVHRGVIGCSTLSFLSLLSEMSFVAPRVAASVTATIADPRRYTRRGGIGAKTAQFCGASK